MSGSGMQWVDVTELRERFNAPLQKSSAYRAIQVAETFGECPSVGLAADPTALYVLSADSSPEEAVQTAIEVIESGERLTTKKAREILRAYTEPPDDASDDPPDDGDGEDQGDASEHTVVDDVPVEDVPDFNSAMRSGLVVTSISREVRKWYRSAGPDGYAVLRSILQDLVSELDDLERI